LLSYCTVLEYFCHELLEIVLPDYTGASSDDALSSGGEFYENENFEFMRPSKETMLKSIPIVPTQKASI